MKITRTLLLAVLCAACIVTRYAGAQEMGDGEDGEIGLRDPQYLRWRLGILGGITLNRHVINSPVYNASDAPTIEPPTGMGALGGIMVERDLSRDLGIMANLFWASRPGFSEQPLPRNPFWTDSAAGSHAVTASHDVTYSLLDLELLADWRLPLSKRCTLALAAGPAVGLTLKNRLAMRMDIGYATADPLFELPAEKNGQVFIIYDNEYAGSARFSLVGGLFADLQLSHYLTLTPGLYYDFPLNGMKISSDWKLYALEARLALRVTR